MFYALQLHYDNGKSDIYFLNDTEIKELEYYDGYAKEGLTYTVEVDAFSTIEEAEKYVSEETNR